MTLTELIAFIRNRWRRHRFYIMLLGKKRTRNLWHQPDPFH